MPALEQGGVERGTVEIARAIVEAGGRALVVSKGGRLEAPLRRAGGEHILLEVGTKSPLAIRRNARAIAEIVRNECVDILHARSRAPGWAGWLAARETGAHFVTTYHGAYSENFPLKRLYNGVMARGRPTIAPSHFIADLIRTRHKLGDDDIMVIHRGADIASFAEENVSAERAIGLADRWGLIDDPRPILLLPGRLTALKGIDRAIEALRILDARGDGAPDLQLVIVGDDAGSGFARRIEGWIYTKGVGHLVRMVGHCNDMEAAYKLASVVLSTSTEPESFGRTAVEAQAMGRPVIASAHGGSLETVEPGRTGWLYPPQDATALADAIAQALAMDPSERAHMGLAARVRVRSIFTVDAMQAATLRVYERAAGRPFAHAVNA